MNDNNNTIAGWVLAAGIAALGSTILFGNVFHGEVPEAGKQGFAIEGVESGDAAGGSEAAAVPLPVLLAKADPAKGEAIFGKCTACHTITAGGAAGVGPNLHGVLGRAVASTAFGYSEALKGVGGNWDFEKINKWIASPKKFVAGNKMTFPGISKAEDRADLLAYLNSQGSNLPLPAAPAEAAAPAVDATAAAPAK